MSINNKKFYSVLGLVFAAALVRFVPHAPNFLPLTAISLFAGAKIGNPRLACLLVFAAMFISDLFLGFHSTMIPVYLSLGLIVYLGVLLNKTKGILPIACGTLASSFLFFVLTNFSVWLLQSLYPKNLEGLIACYVAALPFFQNSIVSDIFYVTLLFGVYAIFENTLNRQASTYSLSTK